MKESIYYNSPLGPLMISSENEAIMEVHFVNRQNKIGMTEDKIDYRQPVSKILKRCVAQLEAYFAGKSFNFDLPLFQPGTAFQQNVWTGLQQIKYGKTVSYLEFSKMLGDAKAIRAVGTANGKNNIAIIVPCHRVIGSNGTLVGYGGDLWRKKWLLEHEAKFAHGVQKLF